MFDLLTGASASARVAVWRVAAPGLASHQSATQSTVMLRRGGAANQLPHALASVEVGTKRHAPLLELVKPAFDALHTLELGVQAAFGHVPCSTVHAWPRQVRAP